MAPANDNRGTPPGGADLLVGVANQRRENRQSGEWRARVSPDTFLARREKFSPQKAKVP